MKNVLNKLSKILLSVLVIAAVVVSSLPVVSAAEAVKNITVKRTAIMDSFIGDKNDFTAFATTNGIIVYCTELEKTGAVTGTPYTFEKNADAGLLWMMKNSYPNKKITGSSERDQYITQSAVWWYIDDITGADKLSEEFKTTDKEAYAGDRNEIIKLVNNAKAHRNDVQKTPSLSLNASNVNLKLTSDKKYFESEYMTANLTNAKEFNVTVSGVKNIQVVNSKGAIQTKFASGENFKIKVPAADITTKTTINVKATTTTGVETVGIYKTADSSFQRVISTQINVTPAVKDINLVATPEKVVNPTCEYKDGKYYGLKGNIVDKATYEKECGPAKKVCAIENGKYFGKDGKEVDKATYDKECGEVITNVPNTGANVSMGLIALGVIAIGSGAGLIAYRKKLNNLQ